MKMKQALNEAQVRLDETRISNLINQIVKQKNITLATGGMGNYNNLKALFDKIKSPQGLTVGLVDENEEEVDAETAYQMIIQAMKGMNNASTSGIIIDIINYLVAGNKIKNKQIAVNGRFL